MNEVDLVTLEEAKTAVAVIGQSVSAETEAALPLWITAASEWFNRETGRYLARRTYSGHRVYGNGRKSLVLEWPIIESQPIVVIVGGTTQSIWKPGDVTDPMATDVEIIEYEQQGWKEWLRRAGWTKNTTIQATYTAGYMLGWSESDAPEMPVPHLLREGVLTLVRDMFRLVNRQHQGISSMSAGGQTVSFDSLDIPKRVRDIAGYFSRAEMAVLF